MKKILKIIALCFVGALFPLQGSGQIVYIDSVNACPGDTILIPVTTTGFNNVAALSLIIEYNSTVASLLGMENIHSEISGAMVNAVAIPAEQIRVGWFTFGSGAANIGTGKLFDLKMVYHGGAVNLVFHFDSELADNNYNTLPTTWVNGRIEYGPTPLLIAHPSTIFVCNGASAIFTVQASNTLTYQWEIKSGGIWVPLTNAGIYSGVSTPTLNISAVDPTMHLSEYRCHMTNFCEVYSNIAILNVSNPVVDAGADDTICFGVSTNLTATVNGGYAPFSFSWGMAGTGAIISVSPTSTQNYQVTLTDSVGCVSSDMVTVIVSNPVTDAGSNDTICFGASKTIYSQTTGGIAPYTYSWQHGGNQSQTTITPTAGQFYTLFVVDFAGCNSSDIVYVEVSYPAVNAGSDDTICIQSTATLNANVAGGYGPYQYLWSNQASTSQVTVGPIQNTLYSVTVTDRFNCVATDQVNVVVSNPVTQLGADDTLCFGQQRNITAMTTGGFIPYSYSWNSTQTNQTINIAPVVTTNYQVTVTDKFGCISGDAIMIYVSNPVVDAGLNDTICIGNQTNVTAMITGGYSPYQYSWSAGGTTTSINVSPVTNTWYKVTVTDIIGCTTTDSMQVAVSNPQVSIGNNDTICINTTKGINAIASGGYGTFQYLWSTNETQSSISVTPPLTTGYSVTVTDKFNCQATASKMVVVSNPQADAGSDQGSCIGTQVTFSGSATGGFMPYTYLWNGTPGQQYTLTSTINTTLYLLVTDKYNCQATDTAYLTAFPNPVLTQIPDDTACFNTSTTITASASGGTGSISYLWNTNAATSTINPLITQNTQFWVRATDINNCQASDTLWILVSNPSVSLGNDDTICHGGSTTLNAFVTGGFAPFSYFWSTAGSGSSVNVSPTSTQTYNVTVTDIIGCNASDIITVVVSNPVTTAGSNDTICYGASKTIISQTTGGIAPYSYSWQHGGNQAQTSITPTMGQTYSITVTDLAGCISSSNVYIGVSQPTVNAGLDDSICINSNTTLNASAAGGYTPYQYLWSNQATTPQITVGPVLNTQYTVTLTDRFNCNATDQVNVLVSNPVTQLGADDTLCPGQQKILTATTTGGFSPYSYSWSGTQTGLSINVTPSATTGYSVTVTDSKGCVSGDNITIFVSNPSVNAGPDDTICHGSQTTVTSVATGGFTPYSYLWSNNGASPSIQVSPLSNTWYKVTVTDKAGCTAKDSMIVTVSNPTVSVGSNDTICINTVHTIQATASGGIGTLQYLWSTTATQSSIQVSPLINTTYSVTVTDIMNCQATASKMVYVSNPVAAAGTDQGACQGATVTFNGTVNGGFSPFTYSWNNNPGQQYQFPATTNTTLVFKVTDKIGCISTDTALLTVFTNPVITPIPDDTVCYNTPATISAIVTGGTGTISYLWNTSANTSSINPTIIQNLQFWVKATDINNCWASDTMMVYVSNPLLTLGSDDTLCFGDTKQISAQITGGFTPYSYNWSTGAVTPQITLTGVNDTCLSLTITDLIGCNSTDTVCIMIDMITVDAGTDVIQCPNDPLNLSATVTGGIGAISYQWSTGAAAASTVAYPVTDSVFVITINDAFGCYSSDSMEVTMHPVPMPNLGSDDTMCVNHIKTLDAGSGFSSYLWSTGASTQTINLDGSVLGTGTFNFSVTVTNQFGCDNSDTISIVVDPCIGIKNPGHEKTVSIVPNPANDHFMLMIPDNGKTEVLIINSSGQIVGKHQINNDISTPNHINTNQLPAGYYLVTVKTSEKVYNGKLVITR